MPFREMGPLVGDEFPQDFVFNPQKVVFGSQITGEKLLDFGDEGRKPVCIGGIWTGRKAKRNRRARSGGRNCHGLQTRTQLCTRVQSSRTTESGRFGKNLHWCIPGAGRLHNSVGQTKPANVPAGTGLGYFPIAWKVGQADFNKWTVGKSVCRSETDKKGHLDGLGLAGGLVALEEIKAEEDKHATNSSVGIE